MKDRIDESLTYLKIQMGLPRHSPGHEECTRQALQALPPSFYPERVLDIGSDTGLQTLELARQLPSSRITALDVHPLEASRLIPKLEKESLSERVRVVQGPLDLRDFQPRSFDLLWSETAVPSIGLEDALGNWRRVLRPDGCTAFTDICWLSSERPAAVAEFWRASHPLMKSLHESLQSIEANGYKCLDWFVLPEYAWWDQYLGPLEQALAELGRKKSHSCEALFFAEKNLIRFQRLHGNTFGAVFFIAQRQTH